MTVKFFPNDKAKGNPPGKFADAELHFDDTSAIRSLATGAPHEFEPLGGIKLGGFAVWERKSGGRNVTFPARQYTVNGERRSYALLRDVTPGDTTATARLRDVILAAYAEFEVAK